MTTLRSSPIIGIDLGTTYSCVAVFRRGKVEVIPDPDGHMKIPSVVAFVGSKRLVGYDALEGNQENTVHGKVI